MQNEVAIAIAVCAAAGYAAKKLSDAQKWKAYYKYGKDANVPPGYSIKTSTTKKSGSTDPEVAAKEKINDLFNGGDTDGDETFVIPEDMELPAEQPVIFDEDGNSKGENA